MTQANDTIVLTIPADARYREVATLVLGGIGSRHDLPYERMDDLQLALLSVLEASDGADVSIEVEARDGSLEIAVGPLARRNARRPGPGPRPLATRRRLRTPGSGRRGVADAERVSLADARLPRLASEGPLRLLRPG